jgi:phage minor structural protein
MLIYETNTTDFTTLGLGGLCPTTCTITEEINGQFELAMQHPIDEERKWEKLKEERIIKAPYGNRGEQLFRIYFCNPDPKTGSITVNARHISYDLADNLIEDTRPTMKNGDEAGKIILNGCQFPHQFTFSSDITDTSTAYYIRVNPIAAFIGQIDQAFIERWGGEIVRDNFNIAINRRIGADNGIRISYAKNITGFTMMVDKTGMYTRLMPTALDANGAVLLTDAKYYDSPRINNYPHPKIGVLNTGIRVGQEVDGSVPYPDEASAKAAMAAMAQAAFDAGADMPKMTLNVSFVRWKDTEEYKDIAILQDVELGDDVTVAYLPLNVDVRLRVVSITWDCLNDKPIGLVIGDKQPNIAKTIASQDIDLSALKNDINGTLREGEIYNGIRFNHEEGGVVSAVISGKTITLKMNGQTGFAVYDGLDYVGGVKVVDGKVLFIGNAVETSATIGGKTITVKQNPTDGFAVYDGLDYVGGVKVVNGKVLFIGNAVETSAVIGGKTITIKQDPTEGFAVYDGSTYVGGVKVVDGKVLFIGNAVETSATIGGKTITVKQNPTDGLAIYDGTTFKGGVKVIDGNVVVVTNWLTNNIDGDCYAVIGDIIVDSVTYKGVLVYNKSVSTSVPVLKIATGSVTSGESIIGGIVRLITYNGASLWLSASAGLAFRLFDASGVMRVGVDNLNSRLYSPNGNNAVGVNDTGVFKRIGENTTYL